MERAAAYRLVRYRGVFAAAWEEGRQTHRRSLRTDDPELAARRFADYVAVNTRTGPTVREIFESYQADREERGKDTRRHAYAWGRLKDQFAGLLPEQISKDVCRRYTSSRRRDGVSNGTILRELSDLRAAIRWHNPHSLAVFEMPPASPPRDRHLTREEFAKLIDACRAPHIELFCTLAVSTAGRAGAIVGLMWNRVDFERGLIHLADGNPREGRKGRATVPMTARARAALLTAEKAALTDYVIEYGGKKVKTVKIAFARTARRAGLDSVTPHVLRHTAAVWMAEAGVSMSEIAQYLGHADDRITQRVYARYSPDHLRKAASALEF